MQRFEAGSVLAPLTGERTAVREYTTVQCGPAAEDNLRIESELVYGEADAASTGESAGLTCVQ